MSNALEKVVEELSDGYKWNWTVCHSDRDAADAILLLLARHKLIKHATHPFGGHIWSVNGRLFGRTDDIPNSLRQRLTTTP